MIACEQPVHANQSSTMNECIYLDANATQPLRPAARDAVLAALERHRQPILGARPDARLGASWRTRGRRWPISFGGQPEDLVFTSGGTEADATRDPCDVAGPPH